MRAVVLAAGDGGRLAPLTGSAPKPLVRLAGKPIIGYTLEGLAAAGVDEAVVVTGYRGQQVVRALSRPRSDWPPLRFVSNSRYDRGASYSLRAARQVAGRDPCLLVMSDHLLSGSLLQRLRAAADRGLTGRSYIAADFSPRDASYASEATKLCLDSQGRVCGIGKELESWAAFDTGAFYLHPSAWCALERAPEDCELSTLFGELVKDGSLFAADVTGEFWYDIDTAADLEAARRLLGGGHEAATETGAPAAG